MVGVINLALPTVMERIAFAAGLGVKIFQFSLPSWGPLNDDEMRRFFAEICDGFPDLKFLHYNLGRTGRLVRPQEYAALAAAHPNLVATKYGAGDPETVASLLHYAPSSASTSVRPSANAASSPRSRRATRPAPPTISAPASTATSPASLRSIASSPA
jgi:dihydrodipicolinate synthase/N-acetylneuraminate lyase